jgi:hypothetical protein
MAEITGVDHVSIGTDQHVSPGSMPDYTQWVRLFAAILGGVHARGIRKDRRRHYMRIFRDAVG